MNRIVLLLSLLVLVLSSSLSAQEYCLYNAMKGYNFGENFNDVPKAILEQPDGKFLFVAESYTNVTNSFMISVVRVFPNGNPDPTFGGGDGKVTHVFDQRNSVTCAALQPDGKILVGGYQAPSNGVSGFRSYVARLNPDGSKDLDFGEEGTSVVTIDGMGTSISRGIEVLPNGRIRVVTSGFNSGLASFRLFADGTLDPDYGNEGSLFTSMSNFYTPYTENAVVFGANGEAYMLAANSQSPTYGFIVGKLDSLGLPVTDFGSAGFATFGSGNVTGNSVNGALTSNGDLLISGGGSLTQALITKIDTTAGEVLTDFGLDGFVSAPIETAGMEVADWIRDEANQEWIFLMGDNSADCGTLRLSDDGVFQVECNAIYTNQSFPDVIGTKTYTCGLLDSEGLLRIGVYAGAPDVNSGGAQGFNASWTYYVPPFPNPQIAAVSPNSIPRTSPTQLLVEGYGLEGASWVELLSATDTISSNNINVVSTEEMYVTMLPELSDALDVYDLRVYLSNSDTLFLDQSVTLTDNSFIAAEFNVLSRKRILINAETTFAASYRNEGSGSQIAFPIVIINEDPMTTLLDNATQYDYTLDPAMEEILLFFNENSIDPQLLQSTTFEDGGNSHSAFLTSDLASGELGLIQGKITTTEIITSGQTAYMNPNALVPAEGLLDTYTPSPSFCVAEMVEQATLTAIPDLDMGAWETCFLPAYSAMQSHLASIARAQDFAQLIPFKGTMMKLCFDLVTCLDPSHVLTEDELEAFNAEMALLLANHVVLDEEFDCSQYVEVSTFYRAQQKPNREFQSAMKSDSWGLGINFNHCMGCVTYNQIEGAGSVDPNEKLGPYHEIGEGYTNDSAFFYTIHFENLESATAPAKRVLIVDSLDMTKFDLNTFRFTLGSWGETAIPLEEETTFYDLRPEQPNILQIDRNLDLETGVVTWEFLTLDTLSMALTEDIDLGFLPPNVLSPEGMGFVGFEVDLLSDLPSGTVIENNAAIYFDFNAPIITNTYQNTFDFIGPESHVNDVVDYVAGENTAMITWETEDDDPSLLFYNIYFNTDGGEEWELWQLNTTDTQAEFTGDLGTTYYFQSIAIDSAMNVEPFANTYDAFIFLNPVSVEEQAELGKLALYPNPAQDQVILSWNSPQPAQIQVFDMMGRQVLFETKQHLGEQYILSIASLAKGCYQVVVSSEGRVFTGQLVKV